MRPQQPPLARPVSETLVSLWASVSHFGDPNWRGCLCLPRGLSRRRPRTGASKSRAKTRPSCLQIGRRPLSPYPAALSGLGGADARSIFEARAGTCWSGPTPSCPPVCWWGAEGGPCGCVREGGAAAGRAGVGVRALACGWERRETAFLTGSLLRQPTSPATARGAPRTAWEWPPGSGRLPSG